MVAKSHALATGFFILLLGAGVTVAAIWFGDYSESYLPYEVVAKEDVAGLEAQSNITYRGVPCGKVTSIELSPRDSRKIVIGLEISEGTPITRGSYAILRYRLVTGDANLVLEDTFQDPRLLPTSPEAPAQIPLRTTPQDLIFDKTADLVDQLNEVAKSAQSLMSSIDVQRVKAILANLEQLSAGLPHLEQRLRLALQSVPGLERKAGRSLAKIDQLVDQLSSASEEITSTLKDAGGLVKHGKEASETLVSDTLPRLNSAFAEIDRSATEIQQLARLLRTQPQALIRGEARVHPGPGERGYRRKE